MWCTIVQVYTNVPHFLMIWYVELKYIDPETSWQLIGINSLQLKLNDYFLIILCIHINDKMAIKIETESAN